MKKLQALAVCALVAGNISGTTAAPPVKVLWSATNLEVKSGPAEYIQKFTVTGDLGKIDKLAFNQFARRMQLADTTATLTEIVPGYYTISSPRFGKTATGDTAVFEIRTRGRLANICYAPDGVHVVYPDGTTAGADFRRQSLMAEKCNWATASDDRMPYADGQYEINSRITPYAGAISDPYTVIPSYKSVRKTGGKSTIDLNDIRFKPLRKGNGNPEYYRITVDKGRITLECAPGMRAALERRIRHNFGPQMRPTVENAVIEDYPDLEYRGIMIDIARNYQTPQEMLRILDAMADYGFNHLHFHFSDDEAWRLEIPGLPELTEVGSRRGYTTDEHEYLVQIFTGDGNPDNPEGTANGYFTRQDFIGMLRHADSLGIKVIPEIESPGHGRAAIKAMEKRYRTTGDASCRLTEDNDTSVYTSAQNFHDNIMNPALEGTYTLMRDVAKALIGMYAEAGVELPAIHIGGDEVPRNAWSGSPSVRKLMEDNGFTTEKQVHAYYVSRILDIYKELGVKISGWQEIAVGHDDNYNKATAPHVYSVNCWSTLSSQGNGSVTSQAAQGGYPVLLSNVDHFYMDMTYSHHPYERGLSWGGTVDEFDALAGYPAKLLPIEGWRDAVKGIQGQVFAETIRSPQGLETLLLPKMLGVAERAWNVDSTYNDAEFHAIINSREMPSWERRGYAYHVRQPGIITETGANGKRVCRMNSPYPGAEIRYTLDGSDPDEKSPVYLHPIDLADDTSQVRARLWINGHPSPVSLLFVK